MALAFGESAAKTRNVRTEGAKVQKRVCPRGIAKVLYGIGLSAIGNAVFGRIETEHAGIVRVGGRFGGNRQIRIKTAAFAGYPIGVG